MPRPLDLLDLPALYRQREHALSLDSTRLLTRGSPLGAFGMMAYLNPARHIYSAVKEDHGAVLFGGIIHTVGAPHARLLYLAPGMLGASPQALSLIEHLCVEAAGWGALHVLSEVDEVNPVFESLRRVGFSVYAWQRFWDVSQVAAATDAPAWKTATKDSLAAIQALHHQIVPPLLHPIEPAPTRVAGLVCAEGGRCHVDVAEGPAGIVLTPLIHPEATQVGLKLAALLNNLPDRRARPVYLCVRSYQAWLEPVIEDLGARPGERQAVMVKHMARPIKEAQPVKAAQPATAIPASHIRRIEHEIKR